MAQNLTFHPALAHQVQIGTADGGGHHFYLHTITLWQIGFHPVRLLILYSYRFHVFTVAEPREAG
jgi:hypothetical protein